MLVCNGELAFKCLTLNLFWDLTVRSKIKANLSHTNGLSPTVEVNDHPAAEQAPARRLTDPPSPPPSPPGAA